MDLQIHAGHLVSCATGNDTMPPFQQWEVNQGVWLHTASPSLVVLDPLETPNVVAKLPQGMTKEGLVHVRLQLKVGREEETLDNYSWHRAGYSHPPTRAC